jgi:hypothetical protein
VEVESGMAVDVICETTPVVSSSKGPRGRFNKLCLRHHRLKSFGLYDYPDLHGPMPRLTFIGCARLHHHVICLSIFTVPLAG